jgi:hypothetical protein
MRKPPEEPPDFRKLMQQLADFHVEVILIGGWAAILHGSSRVTLDVDVVYRRSDENMRNIVSALAPLHPYLRNAPPGLPFLWDEHTLRAGLNFTLTTDYGSIDFLGEVTGGGAYEDLLKRSLTVDYNGLLLQVVDLEMLIRLKTAAGRPKDFEPVAELKQILARRKQS